jgi:phosphatidyl-myo-inositol dimannoside synthase
MNLLFCCHDFRTGNLRLMPWRYIYELANGLAVRGHNVSIISLQNSATQDKESIDGIPVVRLVKSSPFTLRKFRDLADSANCIVWSSSPMTVFLKKKLMGLNKPLILLYTGPFYSVREITRAQYCQVPFGQLASHYKNALAPIRLTAAMVNAPFVASTVVLSEKNALILKDHGCRMDKVSIIPPGRDRDLACSPRELCEARESLSLPKGQKIVIYLGSLYRIRGVDHLLRAVSAMKTGDENILLLILARTERDDEVDALRKRVARLGIANRTRIVHGILEKGKVIEYLNAADIAALPFILVPSDMPVGALEAMALGKPVITTEIDGMPEMVDGRGLVVPPGNAAALAQAIGKICNDELMFDSMRAQCLDFMSSYPDWDEVAERFDAVIRRVE